MMFSLGLLALLLQISVLIKCDGADIKGKLDILNKSKYHPMKITLDGEKHSTFSKIDGSFVFYDILPGIYSLSVHSTDYIFPQIKIEINGENEQIRALAYSNQGSEKEKISYPLRLKPVNQAIYFEVRKPFNIMNLFKNPMMIFMFIGMVAMVFMPKMMANMDPKSMEEMRRMQGGEDMPDIQSPADIWNAIMGNDDEATTSTASSSSSRNSRSNKNHRKR